jgi:pimeloyl-ACP methyl ester carboxylesterase
VHYQVREVDAGPSRLRVRVAGAGPTLVLLPGLGRPAEDLDPFAALLATAGFRVVQPDPRGSGRSTGPLQGLTLHDLGRDIAAVIEAVGGAPAVIIGHAFGNRIARTVAADRPDLVRAVVLLSASGKVQPTPEIAEAIRLAQAVDTPPDVPRARCPRRLVRAGAGCFGVAGWLVAAGDAGLSRGGRSDRGGGLVDRGAGEGAGGARLMRCQRAGREWAVVAGGNRRAGDAGGT